MIKTYLIVALVSYLLGSIPFGYILVKLFLKQDIRATGSGNIGATNVARSGAKGLAIATLVLDALKGTFSVLIAAYLARDIWYPYTYGESIPPTLLAQFMAFGTFMAVLGHMFPIWLKFKGGKGVATAVGGFAVLAPKAIVISLMVFLLIVAITRFISLGSIAAAAIFPYLATCRQPLNFLSTSTGLTAFLFLCLVSLLVILKHHENIRRLIAGTENKFGAKKSVPPPDVVEKQA